MRIIISALQKLKSDDENSVAVKQWSQIQPQTFWLQSPAPNSYAVLLFLIHGPSSRSDKGCWIGLLWCGPGKNTTVVNKTSLGIGLSLNFLKDKIVINF